MGFRNPITSVTDVNTSGGAGPGVHIYQQPVTVFGAPAAQGVIEFDDGVVGDVAPTITVTPGDVSGHSDVGGHLVMGGGSFSGLPVPTATLSVQVLNYPSDVGREGSVYELYSPDVISLLAPHVYMNGALLFDPVKLAGLAEPNSANAGWATGWTTWSTAPYQDLAFYLTRDGMVHVNGLAKYTAATGAGLKIFGITTAAYLPRNGNRPVLDGSVNDTPRTFEVRSDGLYLRGALPTAGQFVSVNGSYPGTTATT